MFPYLFSIYETIVHIEETYQPQNDKSMLIRIALIRIAYSFELISGANCNGKLNTLTEVEEPAEMGKPLGTGAHRHKSVLPPGVKYVPRPWVLRRKLSNRS